MGLSGSARPGAARGRRVVAGVAAAVLGVSLAAGCSAADDPRAGASEPSPTTPATPVDLTLSVYGPAEVTDVYRDLAARWSAAQPGVEVEVQTHLTRPDAMAALTRDRAAGDPPDLFLAGVDDLPMLLATDAVRRVDDLLAARQVDFGDGYNRRGLEAFGRDAALQCMPVDVSPLVVYYNPQLIELDQIAEEGRAEITQDRGWTLEEFARAAEQPRSPGVRGLYVSPRLDQVAPFVYSGGGDLVDDLGSPTTLSFADDTSAEALRELLTVVRDPGLTFGQQALERKPALERFIDGELGMMLGYRDLTGVLREHPDLTFDVMPMPVIGSASTSGRFRGLCLSQDSANHEPAADLLVALADVEAQNALGATGYVMPTNLQSLASEEFEQPGARPLNTAVFVRELRDIEAHPASENWAPVAAVASRQLSELFYDPLIEPLEGRLQAIDDASRALLAPDELGGDPSDDPGENPGDDPGQETAPTDTSTG